MRMRKLFGRGVGKVCLARAYPQGERPQFRKIGVKSITRMIVYSSEFLQQSFRDYGPRYDALRDLEGRVEKSIEEGQGGQFKQQKLNSIREVTAYITDPELLLGVTYLHAMWGARGGFIENAQICQKTLEVFFPLHMAGTTTFWHLKHLSMGCESLQQRLSALSGLAGPPEPRRSRLDHVVGFRCGLCGLLRHRAIGANSLQEHHAPSPSCSNE